MKRFLLSVFVLLAVCSYAHADELSEIKSALQSVLVQVGEMQGRIEQLEQEKKFNHLKMSKK